MSVSRDEFVKAFQFVWESLLREQEGEAKILAAYSKDRLWTEFVLDAHSGLARRTMNLLNASHKKMDYVREWFRTDALYVSGDTIWGDDPEEHFYPTKLHVLVENENGVHWDTELWRLAHLKADLKVLIGYDFGSQNFTRWIKHGDNEGKSALEKIRSIDQNDVDKFLLIVGSRDAKGRPEFRYLSPDGNGI